MGLLSVMSPSEEDVIDATALRMDLFKILPWIAITGSLVGTLTSGEMEGGGRRSGDMLMSVVSVGLASLVYLLGNSRGFSIFTEFALHVMNCVAFAKDLAAEAGNESNCWRFVTPFNLVAKHATFLPLLEFRRAFLAEVGVQTAVYACFSFQQNGRHRGTGSPPEFLNMEESDCAVIAFFLSAHLFTSTVLNLRLRQLRRKRAQFAAALQVRAPAMHQSPDTCGEQASLPGAPPAEIFSHPSSCSDASVEGTEASNGRAEQSACVWKIRGMSVPGLGTVQASRDVDAMSQGSMESYSSVRSIAERITGLPSKSWSLARQVVEDATSAVLRAREKSAEMLMWRLGVKRERPEWLLPAVVLREVHLRRRRTPEVTFEASPPHGDAVDAIHFGAVFRSGRVLGTSGSSDWATLPAEARDRTAVLLGLIVEVRMLRPPLARARGTLPPV